MHHSYCPTLNNTSKEITILSKEELHHIRDVLRLKTGDKISVFNGTDVKADCRIKEISKKSALLEIITVSGIDISCPKFLLACAIPKKSKFETIIEKATELGIDEIIPMTTKRTEIILKDDKKDKKIDRYRTVAINAAKQSKRITVPKINTVANFKNAINAAGEDCIRIIPSLQKKRRNILDVLQSAKNAKKIAFFVGPEGDFTDEEYLLAEESGCIPVSLGETVLKVETAAICAISVANIFFRS